MKKLADESWRERRIHKSPDGTEYYNYPSPLAEKYWHYVLCIGRARMRPGYRYQPPRHDGFLLHYIRRGDVWHHVRGRKHAVSAGRACLMDMSGEIEFGVDGPKSAQNWWVLFNGRDLPHLFTELRADREPVFDSLDTVRYESLYLELIALTRTRPPAYEAKSNAVLSGMVAELFASRAQREAVVNLIGRNPVLSEPVRKAIDYMIRFHSESDLGLKRICDAAGLSLHHFVRLFRRETGVTPIQYLNRYRVEKAKGLLEDSGRSIEEIARLVGSSSQTYFAYLFRKQTGTTPREHRAKAMRRAARI
jgi:AraC-like DNA-binding protein